jgi:dTDP-4-amino-4,6-dideoxy-D-galactose acyltransferase
VKIGVFNQNIDNTYTLKELKWDTDYFGVTCAKAILNDELTKSDWDALKERLKAYKFISIENRNSNPANTQLIGKNTSAFLADVNIQFIKHIDNVQYINDQVKYSSDLTKYSSDLTKYSSDLTKDSSDLTKYSSNLTKYLSDSVKIYHAMEPDDNVLDIADFKYSKFTEDPALAKRGGSDVYKQWLINSFYKPDKYFAISVGADNQVNGFLLHSYSERTCTIELIAVEGKAAKSGIGTSLFSAVEKSALHNDCDTIRVGTQVRNMNAVNFYHKVGCKQAGCHQVYHLWN